MTKNRKLIILAIIPAVLFISSYLVNKYEESKLNYIIDTEYIESILHPLEDELETIVSKTAKSISSDSNIRLLFEGITNNQNSKFTVLIYQNDSLKFWTSNTVPIPYIYNDSVFRDSKIVKLGNGWYEVAKVNLKDCNIIGLLKIKNNYYYDNQYLKTEFVIGADIPSSVILSTSPISIGRDINNKEGKYLFSLIPSKNFDSEYETSELPFLLFYFSIISVLFFFTILLKFISDKKNSFLISAAITVGISVILIIISEFSFNGFLIDNTFNSRELYSGTFPFSSFAKLLIYASVVVFISVNLFRVIPFESIVDKLNKKNESFIYLFIFGYILVIFYYYLLIYETISAFLLNSTITVNIQNLKEFDIYAFFAHLLIGIAFLSFIIISDHFIKLTSRITKAINTIVTLLFSSLILVILNYYFINEFCTFQVLSFIVFIVILIFIRYYKQDYSYYSVISIIFAFSVFIVIFEHSDNRIKEAQKESILINRLADERDEMAERFLREINNRLVNDTVLINKITNVSFDQDLIIHEYLRRKYFYGFWEKYDLSLSLCGNTEFYESANQALNCQGYYSNKFNEFGKKVENTVFWFLNDNSGKIIYTGVIKIPEYIDNRDLTLYITLNEKLISKSLGYPKLLIDKSTQTKTEYENYSYAKYNNGILSVKSGKYFYDLIDKDFAISSDQRYSIELNGYNHLVLSDKKGQRIVLSKEKTKTFDLIISFAYLFVFYNFLVFISILFSDYRFVVKKLKFNFTNQLRFAMIFILVISFVIFGIGTVYYTVKQYQETIDKEIGDKIQSVLVELKHKLQDEEELTPAWHTDRYDHLDELLIKFSQVFFSDINLYDLNGYLLATSRSEIFNKGLIGKQMDSEAFKAMSLYKKTEFIHKEKIGNLEYSSIYIPLKNDNNKIISYINLPYFIKTNKLKKNISDVLITTLNLYVVLFLLTIFLAFIISTEITRPLRMLQSKFKAVQLGKKQQEIIYNKDDEIGALVKEYNLMVSKLETSVKKLAESERESAWREMAKQIAHEIKNPLTPMKLSIQLLQKTWYDKIDDTKGFEKRLNSVSETLIEQINTLSSIASEFSAFAKMPKARNEEVNIIQKLKTVTGLFENTENIDISFDYKKNDNIYIIADKEQVSRVFINLIKNSIQAIPKKRKGKIKVLLLTGQTKVTVIIEDNGAGIPNDKKNRLFEPSFTTKTTGMGIGLAIVKNIVNSAGGDIWFESKVNKGTKFFIEFLKA
ncbi:MAG: ATP-binding protein [Bacteroidales bacterium]|nr:ATP-binding protein [Bacteroidales bacterium]